MHAIAPRVTMPGPPLQQKVQKNFRLTEVCVRMMQQLAMADGLSESGIIEQLVRKEIERRGREG